MTAKEYLEQIKKLDTLINNKLAESKQWLDLALNITSKTDGERVQSSGDKQTMANAIEKCVDIEREVSALVDEYISKKKEIIKTIEQLPEAEYDVLHKIYVQYKTLYEVADERDIAYSWATSIHGRALKSLDEILKNT